MIPLYGFVEGDTLGLLVLAGEGETMRAVADRLRTSAAVRVADRGPCVVVHRGRTLPPDRTVTECGLTALERIDLEWRSA